MRILLDYRPALRDRTGVGEYAHQMAAALIRQRATEDHVTLFSSSWKNRLSPDALPGAEPLDRRIPVSLLNLVWHRLGWPPVELLGGKADVVWSMHPLLMPAAAAARVVTIHDLFFMDDPTATFREVRRDYATLAPQHARRAEGVIVVSEYTRDQVVKRLSVPADRIAVCPNGAPAWQPRPEPPPGGPILHVGTVSPRKNVPAVIQAYLELSRRRADAPTLMFAGRAEPRTASFGGRIQGDSLNVVDRDVPVPSKVRFLGYVSDEERLRLYRQASMLVMASTDEGFGLPALEAMTLGLPVVASARGALPEVVGDAGLLVREDDPSRFPTAFADAMERILTDGDLRNELRGRGITRARIFNWDESAAKARQALAAAIERRKTPGRYAQSE